MGYERNRSGRGYDDTSAPRDFDYGQDYGAGRDYTYSSARDYEAAGQRGGGDRYGARDYGNRRYAQRDQFNRGQEGGRGYDGGRGYAGGGQGDYRGSYAHDGRRFEDVGRYRHADDDNRHDPDRGHGNRGYADQRAGGYGRNPQGYDYEERGFFARAGDEVRSWFGDDDAERRREADSRLDERSDGNRDGDYDNWRRAQIRALDRDYDEYRRENQSKFHNEFSSWRTNRQGQRDALGKVEEHMDVVGSDGAHVGTVDKVRGDRILLTRNDADAGGRHHSIPSSWITTVDTRVTLSRTADEAKKAWKDEERNQALFGDRDDDKGRGDGSQAGRQSGLNRSFSGTY